MTQPVDSAERLSIGPYKLGGRAVLAPMAGITDRPFRQLCRQFGAAAVTSEMTSSKPGLEKTQKSRVRRISPDEESPRIVQIAGTDPHQMAAAAQFQFQRGAQVIDINMGCPAKKVCRRLAGSALLRDEKLVTDILRAVVRALPAPVTLKIRTGWDSSQRNAVSIAKIAEDCGIEALAVHGRTRADRFSGVAEYDTIAEIVQVVDIPVIANGDILSPRKAREVLDYTGAAAVMIGRGAQGQPWIFSEINALLNNYGSAGELHRGQFEKCRPLLCPSDRAAVIISHLRKIHAYYRPFQQQLGVKIARKHMKWYLDRLFIEYYLYNVPGKPVVGPSTPGRKSHLVQCKNKLNGIEYIDRKITKGVTKIHGNGILEWELVTNVIKSAQKHFNRLTDEQSQLDYVENFFGELQKGETAA